MEKLLTPLQEHIIKQVNQKTSYVEFTETALKSTLIKKFIEIQEKERREGRRLALINEKELKEMLHKVDLLWQQ